MTPKFQAKLSWVNKPLAPDHVSYQCLAVKQAGMIVCTEIEKVVFHNARDAVFCRVRGEASGSTPGRYRDTL